MAYSVADQVRDDLRDPLSVGQSGRHIRLHLGNQCDPALPAGNRADAAHDFVRDLAKRHRPQDERECAGLGRRQCEQVVDETTELLRLAVNDLEIRAARLRVEVRPAQL